MSSAAAAAAAAAASSASPSSAIDEAIEGLHDHLRSAISNRETDIVRTGLKFVFDAVGNDRLAAELNKPIAAFTIKGDPRLTTYLIEAAGSNAKILALLLQYGAEPNLSAEVKQQIMAGEQQAAAEREKRQAEAAAAKAKKGGKKAAVEKDEEDEEEEEEDENGEEKTDKKTLEPPKDILIEKLTKYNCTTLDIHVLMQAPGMRPPPISDFAKEYFRVDLWLALMHYPCYAGMQAGATNGIAQVLFPHAAAKATASLLARKKAVRAKGATAAETDDGNFCTRAEYLELHKYLEELRGSGPNRNGLNRGMGSRFERDMLLTATCAYSGRQALAYNGDGGGEELDKLAVCYDRFGAGLAKIRSDVYIYIAGEHEDYYDPDFDIYNDVIVLNGRNFKNRMDREIEVAKQLLAGEDIKIDEERDTGQGNYEEEGEEESEEWEDDEEEDQEQNDSKKNGDDKKHDEPGGRGHAKSSSSKSKNSAVVAVEEKVDEIPPTWEIYSYSRAAFPPTDFFSITPVDDGNLLLLIGNTGHAGSRCYAPAAEGQATTQVLKLDLTTMKMEKCITFVKDGARENDPGWVSSHTAQLDPSSGAAVIVSGGNRDWGPEWETLAKKKQFSPNPSTFSLDLSTMTWTKR